MRIVRWAADIALQRAVSVRFRVISAEGVEFIALHLQIGDRLGCKGRELVLINRTLVEN